MNKTLIVCILVISACSHSVATPSWPRVGDQTGCVEVSVFGGVANDGLDDTPSLNAFNASSYKCLHVVGQLDFDTPKSPIGGRRPYYVVGITQGKRIVGDDPSTSILNLRGDTGAMDWHGVQVLGDDVSVERVKITTIGIRNTIEQTHALYGIGPLKHIRILGVVIDHPLHEGMKGGDDMEFFGYGPDRFIEDLMIADSECVQSSRSCFSAHSGVHRLVLINNKSFDARGQDFDLEGSAEHEDWIIAGNKLTSGPHSASAYSMELAGVTRALIMDNTIVDRGLLLYDCDHCTLLSNHITASGGVGTSPLIEIIKNSNHLRLIANDLTRLSTADHGVIMHVGPHGLGQPADVYLEDNIFTQWTDDNVVAMEGVVGLNISGGTITQRGPTHGMFYGLSIGGTPTVRADEVMICGVSFAGWMKAAISTSGSRAGVGRFLVMDNHADADVMTGLRCEGTTLGSAITGPVMRIWDQLPSGVCGSAGFVKIITQ